MALKKEDILRQLMFQFGHLPPQTSDEIDQFEKIIDKKRLPKVSAISKSPLEIVGTTFIPKTKKNAGFDRNQILKDYNYSMAARTGIGDLDEATLKKMEEDRDKAQKKSD